MEIEETNPNFLCYVVPKILCPLIPISNKTIFPMLVPTAKNLFPVAEIEVGIPIEVLVVS